MDKGETMFIVLSGVSSSGKNTVMEALINKRKDLKILEHSSGTTRAKRESDERFNTYVYLSKEEFEKKVSEGKFYEYEIVHDNYYGMFISRLEDVVADKNFDYIRDIDVKGNISLKKYFEGKCPMLSIFLDAPNHVLRERLLKRGDTLEDIEKRLSRSELERSYKHNYDLIIENIDLDKTVDTIISFIEEQKTSKNK